MAGTSGAWAWGLDLCGWSRLIAPSLDLNGSDDRKVGDDVTTAYFDDEGAFWPSVDDLLRHIGATFQADEIDRFLLQTMGYIRLDTATKGVSLSLWPGRARAKALTELFYWLHDHPCDRVALTCQSDEGPTTSVVPHAAAIRFVIHLIAGTQSRARDFLHVERDLGDMRAEDPFAPLLELWRSHAFTTGMLPQSAESLLKRVSRRKYLLVEFSRENERMSLAECGDGHSQVTRHYLTQALGARPEDVADHAYGDWAASCYRLALRRGIVDWPRQGRSRLTYERLMLPMGGCRAQQRLLVVTARNAGIDLRAASLQKIS